MIFRGKSVANSAGAYALTCLLIITLIVFAAPGSATAEYPDRAITMIVPYAPGGVTDLGARALADAMEKHLKKPVVIVNKPGGGTTIGGNAVAAAKPDGYTLGFFPTSASIPEAFTYFYEAPYSSKDLKPACRILAPVLAITVKADSSMNSVKDLVEASRKAGGMKMATHGKSTLGYLALKAIGKAEKVNFTDVPYAGDAEIVPAVLGGHVPVGTPGYPSIKSLVDSNKVKTLALLIEKRADFAPNTPTVIELGYKLGFISYLGVFAPKGTPDDIIKQLNDVVAKISQEPDFRTKINNMGTQITYENTASFQKSMAQYKENLAVFFKEEGLVK